jgi:hypothetical protein
MKIFGCRKDELSREFRILHNEEQRELYGSPEDSKIEETRMGLTCSTHGEGGMYIQNFGGKSLWKTSIG